MQVTDFSHGVLNVVLLKRLLDLCHISSIMRMLVLQGIFNAPPPGIHKDTEWSMIPDTVSRVCYRLVLLHAPVLVAGIGQ